MSEAVADYAESHPRVDFLHVWIGDGSNNNCECASCRKMRPSDYYLQILNRIDRLLTERDLSTRIVFLAYVDLLWPPEHERFENPERFVLMFAPITRSYSSPFEPEGTIPEIGPYDRNKLSFPKSVAANVAHLRAWQELFEGDGFDFDYHMMWDHYLDPGYEQITDILYQDLVNLRNIDLEGYMSCQVQRTWFPSGLPMHVMGETLWDRKTDLVAAKRTYYDAAFGARGSEVAAYLKRVSQLFDPVYLRGEREEPADAAAKRFREAKRYLEASTSLVERIDGDRGLVLRRHNELMQTLAEALELRALGRSEDALAAWERARSLTESFEDVVIDRFDTMLFGQVIGGRLFGKR